MIAVAVQVDPFDPADATLEGILGTDQLRPDTGFGSTPDKVYIWNGEGYDDYILQGNPPAWSPSNPPVTAPAAMWIQSASGQANPLEVTITGQAIENPSASTEIVPGLHFIGYQFSSKIDVNDTTFIEDGAAKDTGFGAKPDKLYLYDPAGGGYTILTVPGGADYWQEVGESGAYTGTIDLGDAFWYSSETNTFNWTEDNPYLDNL
jgi:hypothetical protein